MITFLELLDCLQAEAETGGGSITKRWPSEELIHTLQELYQNPGAGEQQSQSSHHTSLHETVLRDMATRHEPLHEALSKDDAQTQEVVEHVSVLADIILGVVAVCQSKEITVETTAATVSFLVSAMANMYTSESRQQVLDKVKQQIVDFSKESPAPKQTDVQREMLEAISSEPGDGQQSTENEQTETQDNQHEAEQENEEGGDEGEIPLLLNVHDAKVVADVIGEL